MRTKIASAFAAIAFLAALVLVTPNASASTRRTSSDERSGERTPSALVSSSSRTSRTTKPSSDADRYGQRESKARAQADYRGGDFVVVGISGGLLLLLLALVIIL